LREELRSGGTPCDGVNVKPSIILEQDTLGLTIDSRDLLQSGARLIVNIGEIAEVQIRQADIGHVTIGDPVGLRSWRSIYLTCCMASRAYDLLPSSPQGKDGTKRLHILGVDCGLRPMREQTVPPPLYQKSRSA